MIRIPLRYSSVLLGHAQADDDLAPLADLNFSVALPRSLYRISQGQPDVILALLQEDETLLPRCYPFTSYHGTQLRLVHLAIRPQLVPLLFVPSTDDVLSTINRIRSNIARLTFANGDHTDCRRENIRELSGDPV